MAISQLRARRKVSGGRYKRISKKTKNKGKLPILVNIGKFRKKIDIVRAGHVKFRILNAEMANVYDPKTKKHFQAKIEAVVENASNTHYVRRNILNKGAIIKTDKGNAKITSRLGQEGSINAVLLKEK